ncbi:hypothetical protein N7468_005712 [Penicillium chermesinum]|uniref:Yeast cell wall synthesis Kre9/Knh1 C-terminal domain-containing protein n=1 Tax=Penicillium chermesinum TaxID=63820 RepID=A0A9W9NZQ5_9EURO|nr:uncharacterized protein N7468_005712 [Penicillium chermesinum]KAJ5232756.1 hypothetical protein N7468_005712 [Penicillium chermesinum]KAJ6172416.1 hypothetical protein N7470_001483 [Penicillium chermesinum]
MRLRLWSILSAFLASTAAQTISGLTFDSRDVVSLIWGMGDTSAATYDFWLCAGDESTGIYEVLARVIEGGVYASGDWVSFRVNQDVGGNDPNAYFLKVVPSTSNAIAGFTSHFTLTNMKGTFSHQVALAVHSMQPVTIDLSSPDEPRLIEPAETTPINNGTGVLEYPSPTDTNDIERSELRKRVGAVVGAIDPHTIPYGEQTGKIRYAPMPKRAGTTIANRPATPQYPPFPFTIATTYLPKATIDWTDTAYATWTEHSIENTAAPAAAPTLNKRMEIDHWMKRWQD